MALPIPEPEEQQRLSWWSLDLTLLFGAALFPCIGFIVVGGLGFVLVDHAEPRYFEIVAQTIPVLLLALILEQNFFFRDRPAETPRHLAELVSKPMVRRLQITFALYTVQAVMLLMVVAGEVAALWVVAGGDPGRLPFAITTAGLVAAAVAMLSSLFVAALRSLVSWLQEVSAEQRPT